MTSPGVWYSWNVPVETTMELMNTPEHTLTVSTSVAVNSGLCSSLLSLQTTYSLSDTSPIVDRYWFGYGQVSCYISSRTPSCPAWCWWTSLQLSLWKGWTFPEFVVHMTSGSWNRACQDSQRTLMESNVTTGQFMTGLIWYSHTNTNVDHIPNSEHSETNCTLNDV